MNWSDLFSPFFLKQSFWSLTACSQSLLALLLRQGFFPNEIRFSVDSFFVEEGGARGNGEQKRLEYVMLHMGSMVWGRVSSLEDWVDRVEAVWPVLKTGLPSCKIVLPFVDSAVVSPTNDSLLTFWEIAGGWWDLEGSLFLKIGKEMTEKKEYFFFCFSNTKGLIYFNGQYFGIDCT